MTSRDIVSRAIRFEKPERVPFSFGTLGISDFTFGGFGTPRDWKAPELPEGQHLDEWGCRWEKVLDTNMGQVRGHPIDSWDKLQDYQWPDPDAPGRFDGLPESISKAGEKFFHASLGNGLFERAHFLRGMNNLLVDFYEHPKLAHELIERILDYFVGLMRNYARFDRIDGISMCDDWGTQSNGFLSLPMWREFYKERYRRLFDEAHAHGWTFYLHTCGKVNEYIEEWIEVGLDTIELQQPRALGIEEIGRRYRGRICFSAPVDIQATLPRGDKEEIRQEAKLLLETWGTAQGGFIASDYGSEQAIGVTRESTQAMFDAFAEFGCPPGTPPPAATE